MYLNVYNALNASMIDVFSFKLIIQATSRYF